MPNRTADTPGVSESALGRMKIAELREHARERGIKGADELRKPELLAAVKDWHYAQEHGGTRRAEKPGGGRSGAAKPARGKSGGARSGGAKGAARKDGAGNTTADTPGVSESALAKMKVGELREYARKRGIDGADELRKPELLAAVKDWHYAKEHGGEHRPDASANGGGKGTKEPARDRGTDAPDAHAGEAVKRDDDGSVNQRLRQLETAVQELGKNLNALVRTLRSTIGM